jgi:hypothetical protein
MDKETLGLPRPQEDNLMKYLTKIFQPIYLAVVLTILASCQKIIPSLSIPPTLFSNASSATAGSPTTAWEYKTLAVEYALLQGPDFFKKNGQPVCSEDLTNPNSPQNSSYPCFIEDGDGKLLTYLNQLGQEGWELVSVTSYGTAMYVYTFKRPLQSK